MLHTLPTRAWDATLEKLLQQEAILRLENGQIIYFPHLAFSLLPEEQLFLNPKYVDPHAKNISYHSEQHRLWGVQHLTDNEHHQLKTMLERFSRYAYGLINTIFPTYIPNLIKARTSFRPVQISNRKTSFRKDDKRLHVDAFPSAPNQGKRILRVFCNINPQGEERIWRIGEPFEEVAKAFLARVKKPLPGSAAVLRFLKITKSYRTLYDHYMLQIHDAMKKDEHYQKNAPQQEIRFPAGSSWIVQTDHVSHAAMQGQHVLEQTFYLPIESMQDKQRSPLYILERLLQKPLV